jgi:N-acyl-phosphatidylethanolamine-hydrolysing phospholipase D
LERELRQLGLLGKIKSAFPWSDTPPSTSPLLNQEVPPLPTPDQSSLQFTWIGHSTGLLYVQKDFSILVDPMFSVRASPYQNSPIGIARDIAPAFSIPELVQHQQKIQQSQLGTFDICCITHDHYDHMDENSIIDLRDHVQLWVVPLGIKKWLMGRCSIDSSRIVELKWWQQLSVVKKNKTVVVLDSERINGSQDDIVRPQLIEAPIEESSTMTITCCPASHWASRTMMDRNFRLWCSFAFLTEKFNFFYCGDTGYPDSFPLFHQIGDALGPFDFCAIPIAAYEPEEMMKDAHVNPKEAVKIHKDLRSNQSVAIHWGSFQLSEEPMDAPPQDLKHAIQEEEKSLENSEKINFSLLPHGGTFVVDKNAGAFAACNDDNESCAIDDCVSS